MFISTGAFIANDNLNNPIVIEWQAIPGQTNELVDKIKSLSDILIPSYAQTETEFARQKPQEVSTDFMLKSLAHLVTSNTDWNSFQQQVEKHLVQFFQSMDWKAGSKTDEIHLFVVARDKQSNKPLGLIQFINNSTDNSGSAKAALSGILPSAQNRGLEKLLMSSIFAIKPQTTRIFLHTRSTNNNALDAYKQWGFVELENKMPNWTEVEYRAEQSDELQKTAEQLTSHSLS